MARLTERELTLIRRARQLSWQRMASAPALVQILNKARAAQAQVLGSVLMRAVKLAYRYSGLGDLLYLAKAGLIDPLRRAACYRKTLEELRYLDSHRLWDIGMTRDDLERFAWQAAVKQIPADRPRSWLITRLRAHFKRQSLIRSLAALDDRSLTDIGIERANIGAIVDRMLVKEFPELRSDEVASSPVARGAPATRSPAVDIVHEAATEPTPLDPFKLAKARRAA